MRLPDGYRACEAFADSADATAAVITAVLDGGNHSTLRGGYVDGAAQIERLLTSGARIDAALALIALELPHWQLRRIAYDDGEWHCALSRTRELADWLDQPAAGRHADLALALLDAFIEAQRMTTSSLEPSALPQLADGLCQPLCCDNFS